MLHEYLLAAMPVAPAMASRVGCERADMFTQGNSLHAGTCPWTFLVDWE